MAVFRPEAMARAGRLVSRVGLAIVVAIWLLLAGGLVWWLWASGGGE